MGVLDLCHLNGIKTTGVVVTVWKTGKSTIKKFGDKE